MSALVDAAWLRLAEGAGIVDYYLTEGWGRNLHPADSAVALFRATSTKGDSPAGPMDMPTFLVDHDPAHLGWAGEHCTAITAAVPGPCFAHTFVVPSRFWEAHASVPPAALRLHILLSYHYFKDHDLDTIIPAKFAPPYPRIFADSGAFSAYTQGATIRWQDYAAWLTRYRHWFTTMSNLDVIGSPEATQYHQHALEDAGLPVLPVFHTGEPWAVLERLVDRYPYIALGGMVPYLREWKPRLMPWLIRCFKLARGRAVFHGFGCTTWEIVKALPWYSVDSSSWGAGFRYGQVPLFDWQRGRFWDCHLGDRGSVGKVAGLIRRLGFDPQDFALRSRNTRAHNCGIAALSYCLASAWLAKRWGGVSGGQQFLVEANADLNTTGPAAQVLFLVDCESLGTDTAVAARVVSTLAAPVHRSGGHLMCRDQHG